MVSNMTDSIEEVLERCNKVKERAKSLYDEIMERIMSVTSWHYKKRLLDAIVMAIPLGFDK